MPTTTRGYVYPDDTAAPDVPADMLALADSIDDDVQDFVDELEDSWQAYNPAWAATVSPAIGNGTIGGRFRRVGKTVDFVISITMGSTTTFGSNNGWTVSLPVAGAFSNTAPAPSFSAFATDTSATTDYCLACKLDNVNRVILKSHGLTVLVGATSPFTWASTDILRIAGSYELA